MLIDLPSPISDNEISLLGCMATRRSCRKFSDQSIKAGQLSQLLWSAQGLTEPDKRTAPSAGAHYPMQVFVAAGQVTDLDAGGYRYLPRSHQLESLVASDLRERLCHAALDQQPWVAEAALTLLLAADIEMMTHHFLKQPPSGKRGERYVYLESGAIAQNVQLLAHGLQLAAVLVGGFNDQAVRGIFELPDSLQPTAMICIGSR
ncbi:MAG: SagB/ThcOx family dehydrogenase [Pseudomonadota bacterium]